MYSRSKTLRIYSSLRGNLFYSFSVPSSLWIHQQGCGCPCRIYLVKDAWHFCLGKLVFLMIWTDDGWKRFCLSAGHKDSLAHNVSFWAQKLHHLVSFWPQNNCCTIFTISGPRNCSFQTISGPSLKSSRLESFMALIRIICCWNHYF